MYRPRIIPSLLLDKNGLVKTKQFDSPNYIGDPINAVRIFNDLVADELIFLDIYAGKYRKNPRFDIIEKISEEAFMPFSIGGGIMNMDHIRSAINSGAEKVILNTVLFSNPKLIYEAANVFGSQAIVASVDVIEDNAGNYSVWSSGGQVKEEIDLLSHIKAVEDLGIGEIMINSITRDGMMCGYDTKLIQMVTNLTKVPVIVCGGAQRLEEMPEVILNNGASACAAGSLFVYFGSKKGIMLNYPDKDELIDLFENNQEV